ncbi:MAG: hypothetical protein AUJ98_01675 [Bacteroidetes bacterium CG2_30_33_31]|nr:MAG: hypothetical protein AUJ98_01675 [Bacteroidetes bacterium CG2_30_33_31]
MFRFENTDYLYLSAIVILLYILWFSIKIINNKTLNKFGEEKLITQLINGLSPRKKAFKFLLINLSIIIISIALANPQLGSKMEKIHRRGADLIIAIDISNSMLAEDIKPNRLTRAKMAISKLIDKLQGDRIGIIVFAGDAYTQLPITTDYGAARMFLASVSTDYINKQGTSISSAINLARETFKSDKSFKESKKNKAIIIITDGEDHEDGAIDAAQEAKNEGIAIYTIGMGLESGAPIPIYKNGIQQSYKKDNEGNTIITKLNDEILKKISSASNGIFIRANSNNVGLDKVFSTINKMDKTEIDTRTFKDYEGWFQIFVLAAIILLTLEAIVTERKGKFASKFNIFK